MRVDGTIGVLIALSLAGCGDSDDGFQSSPVDVSGSYTVSVTNQANDCNFPNWEPGKQTTGIPITIVQDGKSISGTIDGAVGSLVQFWLGSSSFEGNVDGDRVHATTFGTKSTQQGACTYTINMVMDGVLTGDALQGVLKYTPKTNGSPDCGVLELCQTLQEFVGARPPK